MKNHMHMQILEISANQVSAESTETYSFSLENNSKLKTGRLTSWWKNAAVSFAKNHFW